MKKIFFYSILALSSVAFSQEEQPKTRVIQAKDIPLAQPTQTVEQTQPTTTTTTTQPQTVSQPTQSVQVVSQPTTTVTTSVPATTQNNAVVIASEGTTQTLYDNSETAYVDEQWLQSLYNSSLKGDNDYYLRNHEIANYTIQELTTDVLKERLQYLNSTTPFHIEYNSSLESVIKSYLKRKKSTYANLMAKAEYYFPMFEEQLDKYDIPLEMKYLAIVESALKPRATSRVGAKGLWQFMYQTGKQFGLNVSSYVDERQDPYRATEAACKYLSSLYRMFNDWDLALAAYNSGPGNVNKAIRRAGGSKNYWNIRHFLPRETAGYVPAFYATLYLFEYANEHNLKPYEPMVRYFETDTIQVKRQLTFDQISKVTNVDKELIQFLNPQYKLDIIPFVKGKNYTLELPVKEMGIFLNNEKTIYAFAAQEDAKREKPLPQLVEHSARTRYRVRSGDYLGKIAKKFGVSVSKLKRWNGLKSNKLKIGQRLTVYPRRVSEAKKNTNKKPKKKVKLPNAPYDTYTVKEGDSLWKIAQKYPNVSVQNIKDWNNIWSVKNLKLGMKLKIFKI